MKTHRCRVEIVAGVLLGALFAGCTSTELERSWTAPETGRIEFDSLMVLAIAPDEALRRSMEDAMRQQVERAETTVSYELIPEAEDLTDRARVADVIQQAGADGVVVMRVVSDENEVVYVPGSRMPPPYTSFWGYYTRSYALAPFYWEWDTGYHRTDRVVGIETNIYNAGDESLIWSGFTRTRDPANVEQLVTEVADVVRERLRQQGLIGQR